MKHVKILLLEFRYMYVCQGVHGIKASKATEAKLAHVVDQFVGRRIYICRERPQRLQESCLEDRGDHTELGVQNIYGIYLSTVDLYSCGMQDTVSSC